MARATSKSSTSGRKSGEGKPPVRKAGTLKASTARTAAVKPAASTSEDVNAPMQRDVPEANPSSEGSAAPEPVVVTAASPVVAAPELNKKELVELAVERSGVKKRDAKPVVEAVLALLGEAVAEGRELNLKPFGKLRINRSQERSNGKVFVCKLRQPALAKSAAAENSGEAGNSSNDPLAEAASEG
ncbi:MULTISPECIES: HU family DNA-binding protein [unclassified Leisingera]|uniref:HU family DNA-binding protein n=1 Tax=unclassified Leisingera TaxID=2614906 RepID=UPI001FFDCEA2|nr:MULTISPECIES: HU family DNA-binding protein [unclassified Leisingera]